MKICIYNVQHYFLEVNNCILKSTIRFPEYIFYIYLEKNTTLLFHSMKNITKYHRISQIQKYTILKDLTSYAQLCAVCATKTGDSVDIRLTPAER